LKPAAFDYFTFAFSPSSTSSVIQQQHANDDAAADAVDDCLRQIVSSQSD
jgi:hypothetical protein